jgi:hypothetical protein
VRCQRKLFLPYLLLLSAPPTKGFGSLIATGNCWLFPDGKVLNRDKTGTISRNAYPWPFATDIAGSGWSRTRTITTAFVSS